MKRPISNSMSKDNDPIYSVITPICAVCNNNECKKNKLQDLDCKYGKKYECERFIPNKEHLFYNQIKDKINDTK